MAITTAQLLDALAEAQESLDILRLQISSDKSDVITAAQRAEMAAIDADNKLHLNTLVQNEREAADQVRLAILERGESLKTDRVHAVYSKPRVRWDAKALDGYAINHPELFAFRTEGKPSVSIRVVR